MTYTPDLQINPDSFYDDSDEVIVFCDKCGKEHSIHNSNEVVAIGEEGNRYEQWCNGCVNEYE